MTRLVILLTATAGLAAAGCGGTPNHTPVTGVVTLDGQPNGDVIVTFVPANGGTSSVGKAGPDGKFKMGTETEDNGVPPGKYKVTISPGPPKDSVAGGHPSDAFQNKNSEGKKVDASKEYKAVENAKIKELKKAPPPSIYSDLARTPLTAEVGSSAQDIKLEMKSDAK